MTARIGSLCSGAGGLDLAVEAVFGAETVWHCEIDDAASKVLAHRWLGVPNHRDLISTDWTAVEPIDILCAGWPCQPFSLAGKRKGADDERAIWPHIAGAVRVLRPRIVVLENVAAVLAVEFGRVADSLAALGYDLRWTSLRASDVGAPHRRERLFVVATDATKERRGTTGRHDGIRSTRLDTRPHDQSHADSARNGWDEGWPESARLVGGSDAPVSGDGPVELLPTPRSSRGASTTETSYALGGERSDAGRTQGEVLLPTPTSRDHKGANQRQDETCLHGALLATPSASDGAGGKTSRSGDRIGEPLLGGQAREMATAWGKYEPAIRRWESVTRPAPAPTEPNKNGNPRLSAAFSEWLMGWPAGWVTEVPGISRNDMLRIVGNGVVPAQAAAAIRWLLNVSQVAA